MSYNIQNNGGEKSGEDHQGQKRSASDADLDGSGGDEVMTARQKKRAKIPNVGITDKAKGQTRINVHGGTEWYDEDAKQWVAAIFHHAIRAELQDEASNYNTLRYTDEREHGEDNDPYNITAYNSHQEGWHKGRAHWHTITDDVLNMRQQGTYSGRFHGPVSRWVRNNKVVLDHDGHAMREFESLCVTFVYDKACCIS